MASGLALPVGVTQGRASLSSGEDQLVKIIAAALSDNDSDNPFQDIGGFTELVFNVNDPATQSVARRRLQSIFRQLDADGRARLAPNGVRFEPDLVQGELVMTVRYVNLETTKEQEFELAIGSAWQVLRATTRGGR